MINIIPKKLTFGSLTFSSIILFECLLFTVYLVLKNHKFALVNYVIAKTLV